MWLLLIAMIIMPFNYIKRGIRDGKAPYSVIGSAVCFTGAGMLLVIFLSDMIGANVFDEFIKGTEEAYKMIAENQALVEQLGLGGLSYNDRLAKIQELYNGMDSAIISTLFCMSGIVCFVLHNMFIKATFKHLGQPIPQGRLAVVREFELQQKDLAGWLMIYVIAFLLELGGFANGRIVVININLLIEAVFALQGISVIFYFFHMKKKPRAFGIIISLFLWFIPFGRQVLLIGGLAEVMFGLKKRIS